MKGVKGFTLLETVTALAVWLLLSAGAAQVLLYASRASVRMIGEQEAFESARASLDALTVNLQLADTILLETDRNGVLSKLTLTERDPDGLSAYYIFYFDAAAEPEEAKYHRLEFGRNNEFASHIQTVRLACVDGRMRVTVVTDDALAPPITLRSSVDVRYKRVTVTVI